MDEHTPDDEVASEEPVDPGSDQRLSAYFLRNRATCSASEAASILGVSKWSVYRAIERGEIKSFRVGRRILIPTAKLLALLEPGS